MDILEKINNKVNEKTAWNPVNYAKEPKFRSLVSKVAKELNYDLPAVAAFAYELLTDVNYHDAAKAVYNIASKH